MRARELEAENNRLRLRSTGLHAAVDSDTDGGVTATRCELFTCSTVLEEELCTTTALTVVGNVSMAASFTAIVGTVQWSSHLRSSLVLYTEKNCTVKGKTDASQKKNRKSEPE